MAHNQYYLFCSTTNQRSKKDNYDYSLPADAGRVYDTTCDVIAAPKC